jgi:glycosyltransferase involved in cell wall biosynthesis
MRVGIVTPRYPPTMAGGGEVSVELLASHLSGHDGVESVTVYSFDGRNRETVDGVEVVRLGAPPHSIRELSNLYAYLRFRGLRGELAGLDVLHAYNVSLNPVVGVLSDALDVGGVATVNSYDMLPKAAFGVEPSLDRRLYELVTFPTTGRVLRGLSCRLDAFVALSEASRQVLWDNGFAGQRIEVIPNMLDPSFEPAARAPRTDGYHLLYVGSLIPEKGVAYLVESLASLPVDVRLTVVGDGPSGDRLRTVARESGVADRVEFTGRIPYEEVKRQYAAADLFVHPGVWPEPFGRTLLEAMESGVPVVATDVGGPADVVRAEELKAPPRDPEALASAIEWARANVADTGDQLREYVRREYAPERVVGRMVGLYEDVT